MRQERSILAGGCFWGMQELVRKLDGVITTRVGYSGGDVANATYRRHGTHAEAIEIVFDADRLSFRTSAGVLLPGARPDDTQSAGQRRGHQLPLRDLHDQRRATACRRGHHRRRQRVGPVAGRVVTEVAPAGAFWEAEPEHQDYLERIPNGYTCHFVRPGWKLPVRDKVRTLGTTDR